MMRSIGEDALSLVGAIGGSSKYRKGGKIGGAQLSPPILPVIQANYNQSATTSSTRAQKYDPFEDLVLQSGYYDNTKTILYRALASDMKLINTILIDSQNAGNNPSSLCEAPVLYHSPTGKYYVNWYTYQNMTTPRYHRVHSSASTYRIKELQIVIDFVIQRTADYVIFVDTYNKKIRKMMFADEAITDLLDLSAYASPSVVVVHNWDKFIILDGSTNSRLFDYNGNYVGNIASQAIKGPVFYHAPSNSIIKFMYENTGAGGHFIEKYNPTSFALISRQKITDLPNDGSYSNVGSWAYWDKDSKVVVVPMQVRGIYNMYMFPIADDGTLSLSNWNPSDYSNQLNDRVAKVRIDGYAYEALTKDGILGVTYTGTMTSQWAHFKSAFIIGG